MTKYIAVDELKIWVHEWLRQNRYYLPYSQRTKIPIADLYDIIERIPTVDAIPVRHGHLVNAHPYGECSECGCLIDSRDGYNYCPNCGARMEW